MHARRTRRARRLAFLLALAAGAAPAAAATFEVEVVSFDFVPSVVNIQAGDTVRWVASDCCHTVTADDGSFNSGAPGDNFPFSRRFDTPGTFRYFCQPHGGPGGFGMSGMVVVSPATPAVPTRLTAAAQSTSEILLTWTDNASNESEVRIERRTLTGTFQQVDAAPAGATSKLVGGLAPATAYLFRVRAANAAGASAPSNEVQEATLALPGPCVEGTSTLCVGGGDRFRVVVAWRTASDSNQGTAVPLPLAPDSGLFYFFNSGNIELLVKVLDACDPPFNRYWVFFGATTNVELTVTVTDTQTQKVRVYFNPLNTAALPVQDTDAFATCP